MARNLNAVMFGDSDDDDEIVTVKKRVIMSPALGAITCHNFIPKPFVNEISTFLCVYSMNCSCCCALLCFSRRRLGVDLMMLTYQKPELWFGNPMLKI